MGREDKPDPRETCRSAGRRRLHNDIYVRTPGDPGGDEQADEGGHQLDPAAQGGHAPDRDLRHKRISNHFTDGEDKHRHDESRGRDGHLAEDGSGHDQADGVGQLVDSDSDEHPDYGRIVSRRRFNLPPFGTPTEPQTRFGQIKQWFGAGDCESMLARNRMPRPCSRRTATAAAAQASAPPLANRVPSRSTSTARTGPLDITTRPTSVSDAPWRDRARRSSSSGSHDRYPGPLDTNHLACIACNFVSRTRVVRIGGEPTVPRAVQEIDREPDDHPDNEADPRRGGQVQHQIERGTDRDRKS